MSALRDDQASDPIDREAERSMQTVYPLQTVYEHRAWTMDSWALPIPPLARRLVRDGRTWRMAVHAAIQHYQPPTMGLAERKARKDEYETFLRTLMYLGPDSDAFARLMLRLFPVARCRFKGCRGPYLRYSEQALHCSDACRRAACAQGEGTGALPFDDACRRCGEPLTGYQRRYCGPECYRATSNAARAARQKAQRAAAGGASLLRLTACAVCGHPVTGRRLRYCGAACKRAADNAQRAVRKQVVRSGSSENVKGETA